MSRWVRAAYSGRSDFGRHVERCRRCTRYASESREDSAARCAVPASQRGERRDCSAKRKEKKGAMVERGDSEQWLEADSNGRSPRASSAPRPEAPRAGTCPAYESGSACSVTDRPETGRSPSLGFSRVPVVNRAYCPQSREGRAACREPHSHLPHHEVLVEPLLPCQH
jgi:ribosomal protein L37E